MIWLALGGAFAFCASGWLLDLRLPKWVEYPIGCSGVLMIAATLYGVFRVGEEIGWLVELRGISGLLKLGAVAAVTAALIFAMSTLFDLVAVGFRVGRYDVTWWFRKLHRRPPTQDSSTVRRALHR